MGDFLQIFLISRSTEILMESNFWLGLYVPYILNMPYMLKTVIVHNNNGEKLFKN